MYNIICVLVNVFHKDVIKLKIEKINESQIKLILTEADLTERDIKLEDLTMPSEKTQALFHDIMEKALEEYDFISENTPLMVEAVPVGLDGIMIIVTKMDSKNSEGFSAKMLSQQKDLHRFKRKPLVFQEGEADKNSDILIYSFSKLDDVIDFSLRVADTYHDASSLYKMYDRYFIVLQIKQDGDENKAEELELILGEYAKKHMSVQLSKYYLIEHGETMIENKAITLLSKCFAC
ncbi:Adapter protein MecA 2 [Clostridium sp. MD294]|nr:Adapter protein MecA 2 [Clostridium sp. MD294]